MAGYPPPYPPPGPPYGNDWRYQRRMMREQARAQRDMIRVQQNAFRARMRGMRRGSIVGPLLVIGLGILFLLVQTGHLDQRHLWDQYGHWWPLLFVGVGVVLLLEWVADQAMQRNSGHPYMRRGIGGGVVVLLIFLGIGGLFANGFHDGARAFLAHNFSINPDNIDEFLGDKHESDQTLDQAFPANASLTVTNPRGDVTISGASDDGQIHIQAAKQIYTRTDADAASKAQQLSPRIATSGSIVNVTLPSMEGGRADLTITVPATAAVTVNANKGDVKLASIKAPISVYANHGDVEASAITGPIAAHINNSGSSFSAHSVTGPVSVEGHASDLTLSDISGPISLTGEFFGTTHLEHIAGPIRFHTSRTDFRLVRLDGDVDISPDADLSADQAVGPVTLTTYSRNITFERIAGDVSVTNRNGSVDITSAPPLGNVMVANRNGSVNVTLPAAASFVVQAETNDGDLQNEFNLSTQENNSRKSLNGTVGQGGSLIRINTTQGDISLKKASIAPLPPTPPEPPPISIRGSDGSSIVVPKDGRAPISIHGSDGSSVIIGEDGISITSERHGTGGNGHRKTQPPPSDNQF